MLSHAYSLGKKTHLTRVTVHQTDLITLRLLTQHPSSYSRATLRVCVSAKGRLHFLKNMVGLCELESFGSGQVPVAEYCEAANETWGYHKMRRIS
jgi:hypothetical protein